MNHSARFLTYLFVILIYFSYSTNTVIIIISVQSSLVCVLCYSKRNVVTYKELVIIFFFIFLKNDVCVLRSETGMDILPGSSALGQYHNPHIPRNIHNFHHHTDQTKSLQELQNEVGALLEFRDLVIETFPDLKHKMASSGANSTITGIPTLSSIVSR